MKEEEEGSVRARELRESRGGRRLPVPIYRTVSVDVKSNTEEEVGSKGKENCSIVSDRGPSRLLGASLRQVAKARGTIQSKEK